MEKIVAVYESSVVAKNYSKYRPGYPQDLWDKIFTFADKHDVDTSAAVDLACGTGHSTFPLCSRFRRTFGVDISQEQLRWANSKAKSLSGQLGGEVEFFHASASKLPFQSESVDLLTCATAWHWLDPNAVFQEIDRVLKKPGTLAVFCYFPPIIHHEQCNKIYEDFLKEKCIWSDGPYGNIYQVCAVGHYKDVRFPYPIAEQYEIREQVTMSLEDMQGLFMSLDCYEAYCHKHPNNTALEDMIQEMKQVLCGDDVYSRLELAEITFTVSVPYFMFLAVKA